MLLKAEAEGVFRMEPRWNWLRSTNNRDIIRLVAVT